MATNRLPAAPPRQVTRNIPAADSASSSERPRSTAHGRSEHTGWLGALTSCFRAGPRQIEQPIPAPRFALPSTAGQGEPHVSAERREAIERLTEIRQRFNTLLAANWAPDKIDIVFDELVLPFAVDAENASKPGLNLTLLAQSDDLARWLVDEACPAEGMRAIFPLPVPGDHVVGVDVRRKDGMTSVLLIEPLPAVGHRVEHFESDLLPKLKKLVPRQAVVTMLALGTQNGRSGCRIFALSAASKLAEQRVALDLLHKQNLAGRPLTTQLGRPVPRLAGDDRIRLLDGTGVLPLAFVKHAQSGTTLQNWLDASPAARAYETINRKRMTLHSRHGAHVTTRYAQPCLEERLREEATKDERALERSLAPKRTSSSIERKRLTYIDRVLDYLRQAPPSVSREFLERIQVLDALGRVAQELEQHARERGPYLG